MPELAEVARIVHFIRKHLVDRSITRVQAQHDDIVYGKAGTSAAEFEKAMKGNKIVGAGQQGKYFWLAMSKPPHVVMHFGMTGWLKIKDADTYYYRTTNAEDKAWPPKFWKFLLETDGDPKVEAAFGDFRRLARIRLVDCPADEIRQHSPLKENGPDPLQDPDVFTLEWLEEKIRSRKVPIKALLLDQATISGIGNWMSDEILYHAKIHPEQYSNTLKSDQIKQLYESINYVCKTSVDVLGDSDQFPKHWLFKHRWSKGKKNQPSVLPDGNKIVFLTVGGRTSAVVPAVQKKTGPVAKDIPDEDVSNDEASNNKTNSNKRKRDVKAEEQDAEQDDDAKETEKVAAKKGNNKKTKEDAAPSDNVPRRRSARIAK